MSRVFIGFIEETCTLVDVMKYDGDTFDKIPNARYVEIFPPLHPEAIKIEKDTEGIVQIVKDDDKYQKLCESNLEHIRAVRDKLLSETDFVFCGDILEQVSEEDVVKWKEYRRKLRDFPTHETTDILSPQWPEKPTLVLNM